MSLTSSWIARHSDVPRGRVVISGTGYNDNVTGVGAAPELKGTLLSLHFYGFWASDTTEAAWLANLRPRIGAYGWRTIIDEAGSPMTIGLNYGNHEGNVYTSYLGALTQVAREQDMGIVYWPGLRTGDSYSMTTQVGRRRPRGQQRERSAPSCGGAGACCKKEPINDLPPGPAGRAAAWCGQRPVRRRTGLLDQPGTALDLWDCNGGGNQSWNWTADEAAHGLRRQVHDRGRPGSAVTIETCTGAANQAWNSTPTRPSPATAGCLTANGTENGSSVVVATCNGSPDQKWTRS